jgi:two-component system, chemotaxis family, protein-glutamate methylesterase/glutaminase
MPEMNGLEMLKALQNKMPTPVIMLSTLVEEGAKETILALELGAFDFIKKPDNIFKISEGNIRDMLLEKIVLASQVKVKTITSYKPKFSSSFTTEKVSTERVGTVSRASGVLKNLVAIGTSTGGPRALQYVLPYLPQNINAGIVIVQHMPPGFTKSLADRLNQLSNISVKEAEDGDVIENGKAFIAPGDKHLLVQEDRQGKLVIRLDDGPLVGGHKPAVNAMMDTLVAVKNKKLIGVIMTGMGSDGMLGMKNVKNSTRFHIIAQNEETCVVYGMPKAVVKEGIADEVVPLEQIAESITKQSGVL